MNSQAHEAEDEESNEDSMRGYVSVLVDASISRDEPKENDAGEQSKVLQSVTWMVRSRDMPSDTELADPRGVTWLRTEIEKELPDTYSVERIEEIKV